MRFVLRRQLQTFAEMLDRFIGGKSWTVGRDLKENPARFPEIDRVKILAIDDRCDAKAKIDKLVTPLQLLLLVRTAKGDVMDGAGGNISEMPVWPLQQIDLSTGRFFIHRKSSPSFLLAAQCKSESLE